MMHKRTAMAVAVVLAACATEAADVVPMVHIPASTFWMGCNNAKDKACKKDEEPQHKVTLSAFDIDTTETTVAQYKKCVSAGKCTVPSDIQPKVGATWPGLSGHPVNFVTWTQAQQYCKWRGAGYDLPTEAQWELAARGDCEKNGSTAADLKCSDEMRTYPWGEAAPTCSVAVMADCKVQAPLAVGSKPAGDSPYGVHDMAGNVFEWTRDWYDTTYPSADQADPVVATGLDDTRTGHGGSYQDVAGYVRSSARGSPSPSATHAYMGMRCVKGL